MITDFAQDENNDFDLSLDASGNMTLSLECNHPVISNLIKTVLDFEVPWDDIYDNNISTATRAQLVRSPLMRIEGVTDVDMTGFNPALKDGKWNYGLICPTIDCDNSQSCITV